MTPRQPLARRSQIKFEDPYRTEVRQMKDVPPLKDESKVSVVTLEEFPSVPLVKVRFYRYCIKKIDVVQSSR